MKINLSSKDFDKYLHLHYKLFMNAKHFRNKTVWIMSLRFDIDCNSYTLQFRYCREN